MARAGNKATAGRLTCAQSVILVPSERMSTSTHFRPAAQANAHEEPSPEPTTATERLSMNAFDMSCSNSATFWSDCCTISRFVFGFLSISWGPSFARFRPLSSSPSSASPSSSLFFTLTALWEGGVFDCFW